MNRLLSTLLCLVVFLLPTTVAAATGHEKALMKAINKFRKRHDLPALERSSSLSTSARGHASSMAHRRTFDHGGFGDRADGRGNFGEIVGVTKPTSTRRMLRWWKNSPTHRQILLGNFTQIGVGESEGYWCVDLAGRR